MKKDEMARAVANKINGVTIAQTRLVIDTFFETLTEALCEGDSYNQKNFGTFKKVWRSPRKGRNPQTREIVSIPATQSLKIVLSNSLKAKLNNK